MQLAEPWYNLSKQDVQPLFQQWMCVKVLLMPVGSGTRLELTWLEATVTAGKAYNGGSYVRIKGAASWPPKLPFCRPAEQIPGKLLDRCCCWTWLGRIA